jgi:hypothetical protein
MEEKQDNQEVVRLAGQLLVTFSVLDNSIASLFSAVFGLRPNSVEIIYANIQLQQRLDCINAACLHQLCVFKVELRDEIVEIIRETRAVQNLRNQLAHGLILDTDFVMRGQISKSFPRNPDKAFVWKTTKKGQYQISPLTTKKIGVAIIQIVELSFRITKVCSAIRMDRSLRP